MSIVKYSNLLKDSKKELVMIIAEITNLDKLKDVFWNLILPKFRIIIF